MPSAPFGAALDLGAASLPDAVEAIDGAGGVMRAALKALQTEGASTIIYKRGWQMIPGFQFGTVKELSADITFAGFDIVVNATPVGTRGISEDETVVTSSQLRGVQFAYDLVYNPVETQFIREARAAGCETLGGLEMFLVQAAAQFRLWTLQEPDLGMMRDAANRALELQAISERKIQPANPI